MILTHHHRCTLDLLLCSSSEWCGRHIEAHVVVSCVCNRLYSNAIEIYACEKMITFTTGEMLKGYARPKLLKVVAVKQFSVGALRATRTLIPETVPAGVLAEVNLLESFTTLCAVHISSK